MIRRFCIIFVLQLMSAPSLQSAFSLSGLCPGVPPALLRTVTIQPRWRDTIRRSMPLLAILGATCTAAYALAEYSREPGDFAGNSAPVAPQLIPQSIVNVLEKPIIETVSSREPEKMQIDAASHDSAPKQSKNLTVEEGYILWLPMADKRYLTRKRHSLRETIKRETIKFFTTEVPITEVATSYKPLATILQNLSKYRFPGANLRSQKRILQKKYALLYNNLSLEATHNKQLQRQALDLEQKILADKEYINQVETDLKKLRSQLEQTPKVDIALYQSTQKLKQLSDQEKNYLIWRSRNWSAIDYIKSSRKKHDTCDDRCLTACHKKLTSNHQPRKRALSLP